MSQVQLYEGHGTHFIPFWASECIIMISNTQQYACIWSCFICICSVWVLNCLNHWNIVEFEKNIFTVCSLRHFICFYRDFCNWMQNFKGAYCSSTSQPGSIFHFGEKEFVVHLCFIPGNKLPDLLNFFSKQMMSKLFEKFYFFDVYGLNFKK